MARISYSYSLSIHRLNGLDEVEVVRDKVDIRTVVEFSCIRVRLDKGQNVNSPSLTAKYYVIKKEDDRVVLVGGIEMLLVYLFESSGSDSSFVPSAGFLFHCPCCGQYLAGGMAYGADNRRVFEILRDMIAQHG
jgi:hypothetical protein